MRAVPDPNAAKCWICRTNEATSGEHMIKQSDLREIFGKPGQKQRFFFHDLARPNREVQSLRSRLLHSPILICDQCNTTRTQPHDRAWEEVARWLRNRQPRIRVGDIARGNRIFHHFTKHQMRNVHLYFLKQLGGLVLESKGKISVDVTPIAHSIMNNHDAS
jgi:hypothetical protein